tara:strand:- start:4361 stop:5458 length:1098 start_codon:yes stop_codon:yes gene_type:complete
MDKDILKTLDVLKKGNDQATMLDDNALSIVDNWIDTGSYVLNALISGSLYGGIPEGRLTMLAGESRTGKSYFVQQILANAQKAGKTPVIFDSENAIDADGARRLGLDPSKCLYVPSFTIEETRNDAAKFLQAVIDNDQKGDFILAIDSLANLESALELARIEKGSTSSDMGSKAKAIASLLRTLTRLSALSNTTVLTTNHTYDDPSAMFPTLEKIMPGGKKTVYLPSVTVQLMRKVTKGDEGKTMDGELAVGQKSMVGTILRALTCKNRFIQPFLEGEMYLSFSTGLDRFFGLKALAVGLGAIVQTGKTYQLPDETKLGFFKAWRKDADLWNEKILPVIEEKLLAEWKYGSKMIKQEVEVFEDEE